MGDYQTAIIGSLVPRLQRTLQVVGAQSFTASNDAIVTSRVVRSAPTIMASAILSTNCVVNDNRTRHRGFPASLPLTIWRQGWRSLDILAMGSEAR